MTEIFLSILNMSLVSAMLIIALLILRPVLKKAPKAFLCALWGLVGLRLVCPFTVESVLSLIPTANPVTKEVVFSQAEPEFLSGSGVEVAKTIITNTLASPAGASINPLQAISLVAAFIWAVGVAVMLIISLVSFLRLKKNVSASLTTGDGVFINDHIASPFVLGFIKPRIYIPSDLTEYEKEFVIAHEYAHIKRRDYLIKPIGYIILSLHWFNPLVWVAYILLSRDIESACDEKVIRKMNDEDKKAYSAVLLSLSLPSKKVRACPVAFGESGVKQRIKSVANYKKPAIWISAVAVVLAALLCVGFMTNPVAEAKAENKAKNMTVEECISKAVVEHNKSAYADSRFSVENFVEIKRISFENDVTAYVWAYYGEYEAEGSTVVKAFESYKPARVILEKSGEGYILKEYETSPERTDLRWIYETFPQEIYESVRYTPGYYNDQKASAMEIAYVHFGVEGNGNSFYPTFNAEVLEVSEKYIVVAPFKGETVSNNTFDKIRLSKKHLTPNTYEPDVGDAVRVRYADIISIDTDPPTLSTVYNLELINKEVSYPYVIYSGGDGAYYIKETVYDNVYVYKSETADVWFPGTYFSLNDSMKTFMLMYETAAPPSGSENSTTEYLYVGGGEITKAVVITGNYEDNGSEIKLCIDNSFDRVIYCFDKKGSVCEFNVEKTLSECWTPPAYLPFEDGARFVLGQGI